MAERVESGVDTLSHLRIPLSQIRCTGAELGKGSFGRVFEVDYCGKLCAAKEIHSILIDSVEGEEAAKLKDYVTHECELLSTFIDSIFSVEYTIYGTLHHPNLVQFLGIYYPS